MTDHIYRSGNRVVLDAWDAAQRGRDEYLEQRKAQLSAWGFNPDIDLYITNSAVGGSWWEGIAWSLDDTVPQYWRRDRDTQQMIVPRRQGAGRKVGQQFDKLRRIPSPRTALAKHGMPDLVMHGEFGRMYASTYAAVRDGDVVWVKWTVDPNSVDLAIWDAVKLSEYYAMAESGSDPFPERVAS